MAPKLESGTYEPLTTRTVTVWPKPDPDGDGEVVWLDQKDSEDRVIGREAMLSGDGRKVRHYLPPKGFTNFPTRNPGSDDTPETYVRTNPRTGGVLRNIRDEAVGIKEGMALVEYADGTHELLQSDYAMVLFGRAHTRTGARPEEEESS